jgi:hypothetical protein
MHWSGPAVAKNKCCDILRKVTDFPYAIKEKRRKN